MAGSSAAPEGLGETLIPAINKLQDIFNQARQPVLNMLFADCAAATFHDPFPLQIFENQPSAQLLLAVQVTLDLKLELPQVAVVGSQSSGKSSVLEALVSTCQ